MSETLQDILEQQGECCITGKSLKDCKTINIVNLNVKARWKYPVWGNLVDGQEDMAIAVIHDECVGKNGKPKGIIKYAIEITGGINKKVIYHDIADLKR